MNVDAHLPLFTLFLLLRGMPGPGDLRGRLRRFGLRLEASLKSKTGAGHLCKTSDH